MTMSTASSTETEDALVRLRAHIEEFITLALTHKLDTQLASLVRSGVLDLDNWDGANLVLPCIALLEAAAERVIWHSHRRRYQRDIKRLKQSL
ncbi:hypothetical protein ACK325_07195 [Aeromonas hydrophila]|uniref:hypothetical protein n=1 Tax=Aeromonas hydrophila TaxID=644 RepID=UPI003989F552